MHKDVKQSLNKVFQQEQLHTVTINQQRKPKKNRLPVIISIAVVALACVLIVLPQLNSNEKIVQTTKPVSDIFKYKHEYIGNNSAMSHITNTVLADYQLNGIQLHTTQEPYGITVHALEEIPQHIQLKYAIYVFSLIQNASFIEIQFENSVNKIDKTTLEETSSMNFMALHSNDALLQAYYNIYAKQIPEIQMAREDSYKYIHKAFREGEYMNNINTNMAPDFTFNYEDSSVSLFLTEDEIWLVKHEKPGQFIRVTGDIFADLQQFLTSDFEVTTGNILEINHDQNELLIGKDEELSDITHLVKIDDASKYKIGDRLTVWSTKQTFSIPAYSVATKVQLSE